MKKISIFLLLFIVHFCAEASVTDSLTAAKTNDIIKHVQKKYAPDKRADIFEANVETGNSLRVTVETTVPESLQELKAMLERANLKAEVKEKLLPAEDLGSQTYGLANLSVSNNRFAPGNKAELVTQALLGTPVRILKKDKGYYLVRTPDNYLSWTSAGGITAMDKAAFEKWKASEKIVYTQEFGHSYSEASDKSLPVSDLVHGVILQLAGKEKKFYKVIYPDNRIAYIPVKSAVSYDKWVARPNPDAEQIINVGKTLMGVPYLWGGTSIKGVDCSGFTKTCYYLNGIILPRDASQQALAGEDVDVSENDSASIAKCLKNLKAGDLLFFGSRRKNAGPIVTHTGIYMGNGEYIHSSGQVRINSMTPGAENYTDLVKKSLVSARRMLTSIGRAEVIRVDKHDFYSSLTK